MSSNRKQILRMKFQMVFKALPSSTTIQLKKTKICCGKCGLNKVYTLSGCHRHDLGISFVWCHRILLNTNPFWRSDEFEVCEGHLKLKQIKWFWMRRCAQPNHIENKIKTDEMPMSSMNWLWVKSSHHFDVNLVWQIFFMAFLQMFVRVHVAILYNEHAQNHANRQITSVWNKKLLPISHQKVNSIRHTIN